MWWKMFLFSLVIVNIDFGRKESTKTFFSLNTIVAGDRIALHHKYTMFLLAKLMIFKFERKTELIPLLKKDGQAYESLER